METFVIPADNMPYLQERLAEITRRAERLGCPAPSWAIVGRETREVPSERPNRTILEEFVVVAVDGSAPTVGNHKLIAVLEPLGNENIIRRVPGVTDDIPERHRHDWECDHCHATRKRNRMFLVQDESGAMWQVGSGCISDFLGGVSPEHVARMAEFHSSVHDSVAAETGYSRAPSRWNLQDFIAVTRMMIRLNGWCSRTTAQQHQKQSTADQVLTFLSPQTEREKEWRRQVIADGGVTEMDAFDGERAHAWACDLDPGQSDFLHNLRAIAREGYVTHRTAGFAAAIVSSYLRHIEQSSARPSGSNEWIGEPQAVITGVFLVLNTREFDGRFGVTYRVTMQDPAGNEVVWWASRRPDMRDGSEYRVRATVKAHGEFRGRRQTVITRATYVEA